VAIAAAVVAVIALIIGAVAVSMCPPQALQARSALVIGNNGTLGCSSYCNNVAYFNLNGQVPTIASWPGATSYTDFPVAENTVIGSVAAFVCV
jgi:hypothetical protein